MHVETELDVESFGETFHLEVSGELDAEGNVTGMRVTGELDTASLTAREHDKCIMALQERWASLVPPAP